LIRLPTPDQWWLLGKPLKRLDVDVKSNGSAVYAIDVRVSDMVYAAVKACPVPWGGLRSLDFNAIRNRPGIIAAIEFKAVPGRTALSDMQNAVAVVADSWYRADRADQMPIEWDTARTRMSAPSRSSPRRNGYCSTGKSRRRRPLPCSGPGRSFGRVMPALRNARAPEPINVTPERVDVWSPTQDQSVALEPPQTRRASIRRRCLYTVSSAAASAATAPAERP
jgi:isoquinoline 1-oxidoreductase beta subunit